MPQIQPLQTDVLVIGGGIAGLGAARELARAGLCVALLEACDRLGGRVLSHRVRGLERPVEFGAEFVHGTNPEFKALARRAGVRLEAVSREIFELRDGRLVPAGDYWKTIADLLGEIPAETRRPFTYFLAKWRGRTPLEHLAHLQEHVEDFNAATVERMSAAALREDLAGAASRQYRPAQGYQPMIEHLENDLGRLGVAIHLKTVVTRIAWRKGQVTVRTNRGSFAAASAIVTLPLGVLKAGAVRFSPALKSKASLIRRLGWGSVAKVTLQFERAFWKRRFVRTATGNRSPTSFPFLLADGCPFPVWWVPSEEPLIVGWAGGPRADPLLGLGEAQVRDAGLRSLATIWGMPLGTLRQHLRGTWTHDWSRDPYSRGGYSFAAAGVEFGPSKLAEPVAATLYFAGEATAEELGTVHGALASGVEAARRIVASIKKEH